MEHHGGVRSVREKMGYEANQKEDGYWKNWENVERELNEVIEEVGHFPSYRELISLGRSDLGNGLKHHGGFRSVRDRLGGVSSEHEMMEGLLESYVGGSR
jgi:hypothetical protein